MRQKLVGMLFRCCCMQMTWCSSATQPLDNKACCTHLVTLPPTADCRLASRGLRSTITANPYRMSISPNTLASPWKLREAIAQLFATARRAAFAVRHQCCKQGISS